MIAEDDFLYFIWNKNPLHHIFFHLLKKTLHFHKETFCIALNGTLEEKLEKLLFQKGRNRWQQSIMTIPVGL